MGSCSGRRILLVDDDLFNLEVIGSILAMSGAEVVTAKSGIEALRLLEADRAFDVVFLDVQMPGMDGCETARRIRRDERLRDLPLVAVTANAVAGVRERCLDAGMNDFLTKPVDTPALLDALSRWAGGRP